MASKFTEEDQGIADRGTEGRSDAVSVKKFHPKNFDLVPNPVLRSVADLYPSRFKFRHSGAADDLEIIGQQSA